MDLFELTQPIRGRRWSGYPLAVLLTLLAFVVRLALGPLLAGVPFLTFFPAIIIASYFGGRGPGLLCALLSGLIAWYVLVPPFGALSMITRADALVFIFYACIATLLVMVITAMNAAYDRVVQLEKERALTQSELEARVVERTRELTVANDALQQEIVTRKEAEARAAQLQRLEAIGQLTGGVAHDFNNMLAIIIGNLELGLRKLSQGNSDIVRHLDGALDGAHRGATLTQRLLAFARRQPLKPVMVDLNMLVSGMSELLRRTLGERVQLECVLAGGLWRTSIDPGQFEGAIVNLAVNARDAMPDGGKLTIETMNAHLDEAYVAQNPEAKAGQYVAVAVSDTGTGMPADVMARAFEPFFTTKEVGRGTGLGLSQIYGYLKQSGGHCKIYSEPGHGTTAKLYFLRDQGSEAVREAAPAEPPTVIPSARGDDVILVVEDEEAVRAATVETLRELGYSVRDAAHGAAALHILDQGSPISLLLTDVVMPGMTGRELADEALRRRPGLKVLFTTGYTRNAIIHAGRLDPGVELLQKPFNLGQLARAVRTILDS